MNVGHKTSVKKNYLYNSLNTITGLLFPLLATPYAYRIVLPSGVGEIQFFSAIIAYITLFASIGIPLYATREIAKVRDDAAKLTKISVEILVLHVSLTIVGYFVVALLASFVAKIQVNIPLFLLLSSSILLTAIGSEWFYRGIEEFKYITIRNLIFRTVALVALFFLVKTKEDVMWYAAYTVFGVFGGNIINFFRLRKHINIRGLDLKKLNPLIHLKPALHIFLLNMISSVYLYLNTVMLGFFCDSDAVGYYTGATKVTQIVLGIVTSLGLVMIPRLSHLISAGKKDEFNRLAVKSTNLIMALSVPLMVALIIMAPLIIRVLCGIDFEPSIVTLRILAPIVFFIALSNLIGIQIFYPQGQENKVIISTLVGACVSFSLNLILIPKLAQNGSAIATVVAESSVVLTQIIIGSSYLPHGLFNKSHLNYLFGTFLMAIGIYLLTLLHLSDLVNIIVMPIVGVAIYSIFLIVRKDAFCMEAIDLIKGKLIK